MGDKPATPTPAAPAPAPSATPPAEKTPAAAPPATTPAPETPPAQASVPPTKEITVDGRTYRMVEETSPQAAPVPSYYVDGPNGPVPVYPAPQAPAGGPGFRAPGGAAPAPAPAPAGAAPAPAGQPAGTQSGALTMDEIRKMSAADINRRWDDVQKALQDAR